MKVPRVGSVLVTGLCIAGCVSSGSRGPADAGSTDGAPAPVEEDFSGVLSGPLGEFGLIDLRLRYADPTRPTASLEGQLRASAETATIELAGSLDDQAFLRFRGHASRPTLGAFECSARLDQRRIRGDCVGGGDGLSRGFDLRPVDGTPIARLCGAWSRRQPPTPFGTWAIVVHGGDVGVAFLSQEYRGAGLGTRTATAVTIALEPNGVATGTVSSNGMSGTWKIAGLGDGTFEADAVRCP